MICVSEYKIGAVFSVTGRASFLGDPEKKTAEMVVEQINQAGGINGKTLNLIVYDDEGDATKAIARALMTRPQLLLLDEPSMGLAPLIVKEIFSIIKELNDLGTTILLVEQNAGAALQISDYGYVLETGRIVLEGQSAELLEDSKVKAAYLGLEG